MNNKQAKVLHTVEHKHKQTNKQTNRQTKKSFPTYPYAFTGLKLALTQHFFIIRFCFIVANKNY